MLFDTTAVFIYSYDVHPRCIFFVLVLCFLRGGRYDRFRCCYGCCIDQYCCRRGTFIASKQRRRDCDTTNYCYTSVVVVVVLYRDSSIYT